MTLEAASFQKYKGKEERPANAKPVSLNWPFSVSRVCFLSGMILSLFRIIVRSSSKLIDSIGVTLFV